MALVKCPECGRERVSDSAEACPECGYGIRAHYEKIRKAEERRKREKSLEETREREKMEIKKKEEERIKSVPKPDKPVFSRRIVIYLIVAISFLMLVITSPTIIKPLIEMHNKIEDIKELYISDPSNSIDESYYEDWLISIRNQTMEKVKGAIPGNILMYGVFVILPLLIYLHDFRDKKTKYKLSKENFEAYQRQIIREEDEAIKRSKEQIEAKAREEAMKPECPYCHSHNTTKITATAKALNTAMFGVLGQKRKYQWHCNKCKSDF